MAERGGFEPPIPLNGIPPFQGGALGHYATSPYMVGFSVLHILGAGLRFDARRTHWVRLRFGALPSSQTALKQ